MSVRKLLRVPLITAAAGVISYNLIIWLLGRFAIVHGADGTVSIDPLRQNIIYLLLLAAALLIGGRFLRDMSRKEVFISASVMAGYGLLVLLIQGLFGLTTGQGAVVILYLYRPFELFHILGRPFYNLLPGTAGIWLGSAVCCLGPYLFLLCRLRTPAGE